MRHIGILNRSKKVTDEQARLMTEACYRQLRRHAAPAWNKTPYPVFFYPDEDLVPDDADQIVILDTPDLAGALGYHSETPKGRVYGKVFVGPILKNGGTIFEGPNSVSCTLSHEVLEQFCVVPETRVLTADLRWVPAGELKIGDGLVGFDEQNPGQGQKRRYRRSFVESAQRISRPCYELTLEDGTVVTASEDHRWLVNNGGRAHWVETKALIALAPSPDRRGRTRSSSLNASRIIKPLDVWPSPSFEDGYLAAAFDGEGCLGQYRSSAGTTQVRLSFSQNDNAMLHQVKAFLQARGVCWTTTTRKGPKDHHVLYISQKRDVVTLLGRCRPVRLLAKFDVGALGCMLTDAFNAPRVISKKAVGTQEVVALRTSTRTFIAEGLASHNCDPDCNLWADDGSGKMFAVEICDPVEADVYVMKVNGHEISVSNFVFPEWFDRENARDSRFDQMGVLKKPFTMSDGGYYVTRASRGEKETYARRYPGWKKKGKVHPAARTARRKP